MAVTPHLRAEVGVKAVIRSNGKILVLRRSPRAPQYPGFWDLPGGTLEQGET